MNKVWDFLGVETQSDEDQELENDNIYGYTNNDALIEESLTIIKTKDYEEIVYCNVHDAG